MSILPHYPHLKHGMFSYDKLVAAIEDLEANDIISFEEFKKMPYYEIQKHYFSTPNPTMMEKAKIMVENKRTGKVGPSEYTSATVIREEGKPTKIIKRVHRF